MGRSDSAGNIHFSAGNVVKKFQTGFVQAFVAGFDVCFAHCGVKIYRANGMSFRFFEFAHGSIALVVCFVEFIVPRFMASSAFVYKKQSKIEIFFVRRIIVHF